MIKKANRVKLLLVIAVAVAVAYISFGLTTTERDPARKPVVLNENSSWCWFQDERVILDGDRLVFAGVTKEGRNTVTSFDLKTGKGLTTMINEEPFKPDDHNVGALLLRPDNRYLTVYAQHGIEPRMRYRISRRPHDITQWGPERIAETGGKTTYSNLFRLESNDTVYNFHRGIGSDPNYMVSGDDGETWHYGGRLFAFQGRPYVRYTSDGKKRVHFITTEDHPRHYNNSIYHGYIEDGRMFSSTGQLVGDLSRSEKTGLSPQDFTCVFYGDSTTRADVAWTHDIELDDRGNPYIGFSVTKDPIRLGETVNTQEGGFDHRYHYARFDGEAWHEYEIAYAGSRLYAGENEYTGLITLHPDDPDVVYISTDVDPATGKTLKTGADRHYEIFKGTTKDGGANWTWTPVTENSTEDNIRPIVVANEDYEVLLWLKGKYTTYKDFNLKVLGLITKK